MIRLTLLTAFILTVGVTAFGQIPKPTPKDDPTALSVEQLTDRLTVAEEMVRLKDEQLKAKDDRLAAKDAEIVFIKQQRDKALEASGERKTAGNIDELRLADAKQVIAKQDAEIARLRNPGFFGTLFNPQFIQGGVVGYTTCKIVGSFGGERQVFNLVTNGNLAQPYPLQFYQSSAEDRVRRALKAKNE